MARKLFAAVTLVAVALSGLVACGQDSADELNVVLVNTPWARAITPHLPEFEEQTGIEVKVQQYAQEQARNRVFVSLSSHSGDLDVFNLLPSNEGLKWQDAGLLADLDDQLSATPDAYDADGFTRTSLEASRLGGQLVGIPVNIEGPVVFYRKDLLRKYDLDVPKTLDELAVAARTIYRESDGHYVTATRGLSPTVTYTFGNFLHNHGLEWTGKDGKPVFDDPKAVRAIEQYVALAGEAGPKGVVNNGPVQNAALMASGRAAFMIDSSNELDSVVGPESKVADDIGVMPIPAGPGGSHPTLLSWNLGVSQFSERKDQAWRFVEWATSPEMMLTLAEDGVAPPRDGVWKAPEFRELHHTAAEREWSRSVQTIIGTGTGEVGPPARDQDTARRIIGDEIDRVMLRKSTSKEAAAVIQDGLEPLVSGGG